MNTPDTPVGSRQTSRARSCCPCPRRPSPEGSRAAPSAPVRTAFPAGPSGGRCLFRGAFAHAPWTSAAKFPRIYQDSFLHNLLSHRASEDKRRRGSANPVWIKRPLGAPRFHGRVTAVPRVESERSELHTCAIELSPLLVVLDDNFGHGLGRTV